MSAAVAVLEERPFAAIAPLGDRVRETGNDEAGEASHRAIPRAEPTVIS
jgi:hypothetical protein